MKKTRNFLIDLRDIIQKHMDLMLSVNNLSKEKQKLIYNNNIDIMLNKIAYEYTDIMNILIDKTFPKE